jgi:thiosulfate/3-mercaptopyruvate sulfurtransferase
LTSVDAPEIQRILAEKGVLASGRVVVYGAGNDDADAVAAALAALGVESIRVFRDGFRAWAADAELPVERLPKHDRLVHIDWLRQVLAGERPEAAPAGPFVLFHVNFGVPEEYAEGHIPGALYLDTNWLEDPADWNRRSPEALETALRSLGITHETTVVVYGRHRGRGQRKVAGPAGGPDRRHSGADDPALRRGR